MDVRRLFALASGILVACGDGALDERGRHPSVAPDDAPRDDGPRSPAPDADAGAADASVEASAPPWDCAKSSYQGRQFWTCKDGAIHRCQGGVPETIACADGCALGPVGTDDVCGKGPAIPTPDFTITIAGGLFTEQQVRKPIEDGLSYALARIAANVDVGSKTVPSFSIHFEPSSDPYASGIANVTTTTVYVPYGYPLTGSNQNYVVNITIHEIGHILAHHLIAPRELRDTCVNEGLASWIAGKYWMNAASQPVASLRAAARYEIARGAAYASMSTCTSASDPWYKVYASYFEYLEKNVPGAILAVSSAKTGKGTYAGGWAAWLQ